MKQTHLSLLILCVLTLVDQGCGQNERSASRNDPTYSTHNYKHANKADSARRWESKKSVAVEPPKPGEPGLTNYKRQVPGHPPVGGITMEYTPAADVASGNYKMQRPGQPASSTVSGVAGRRKKRRDAGTATGD